MGTVQSGIQFVPELGFVDGIVQLKIAVPFAFVVDPKIIAAKASRQHPGGVLVELVRPAERAQSVAVIVQGIGSDAEIVTAVVGCPPDLAVLVELMVVFYDTVKERGFAVAQGLFVQGSQYPIGIHAPAPYHQGRDVLFQWNFESQVSGHGPNGALP